MRMFSLYAKSAVLSNRDRCFLKHMGIFRVLSAYLRPFLHRIEGTPPKGRIAVQKKSVSGTPLSSGIHRQGKMKAAHPMLLFMLMLLGIFVCCALFIRPEGRFTEEPAVDTAAGADAGQMDAGGPEAAETPEKVVYLTFDDGPSAVTEDILDYLQEEEIPATFFVIGMETDRAEKLLKRMVTEGHAIGLHTYSHKYSEIYASPDAFFADQEKLCNYLKPIIGYVPTFFRFPGGSCNATAEEWTLNEICRQAKEKGLVWFDWNSLAEDSGATAAPADQMAQNIISTGGEKNRILILMHDNSVRTTAVDCLRIIVPYYKEKGYTFKALTADTKPIQFRD